MNVDPTIPLGTIIHLGFSLLAVGAAWGSLRHELREIKERLGCAEEEIEGHGEKGMSLSERLRALETDSHWIKKELERLKE